jgi:tRNA(fMet)-specific endonuclease VapC
LDTTFLIGAERESRHSIEVISADDDVAVAAITLAELRVGALLTGATSTSRRSERLDELFRAVEVISYDAHVAEAHAGLMVEVRRQGRPRGAHDLIIAATAVATERSVVTADPSAFVDLSGVEVIIHR